MTAALLNRPETEPGDLIPISGVHFDSIPQQPEHTIITVDGLPTLTLLDSALADIIRGRTSGDTLITPREAQLISLRREINKLVKNTIDTGDIFKDDQPSGEYKLDLDKYDSTFVKNALTNWATRSGGVPRTDQHDSEYEWVYNRNAKYQPETVARNTRPFMNTDSHHAQVD